MNKFKLNINTIDEHGNNNFYYVCKNNNHNLCMNILDHYNTFNKIQKLNVINKKGHTPLLAACKNNMRIVSQCIVKLLSLVDSQYHNYNAHDKYGDAQYYASLHGYNLNFYNLNFYNLNLHNLNLHENDLNNHYKMKSDDSVYYKLCYKFLKRIELIELIKYSTARYYYSYESNIYVSRAYPHFYYHFCNKTNETKYVKRKILHPNSETYQAVKYNLNSDSCNLNIVTSKNYNEKQLVKCLSHKYSL